MIIDWEIGVEQSGVKMESFMRQKFSVLILGIILFSPFFINPSLVAEILKCKRKSWKHHLLFVKKL